MEGAGGARHQQSTMEHTAQQRQATRVSLRDRYSLSDAQVRPWKVLVQELLGGHLDQLQCTPHPALGQVAPKELQGATEVGQTLFHITTLK